MWTRVGGTRQSGAVPDRHPLNIPMKISEITLPKTRENAQTILSRAGYETLGKGAFASVYEKPGRPYVIKLFSKEDDAYRAFIDLARKHPNKHFPKFFGKLIQFPDFYGIRMEKLAPYTGNSRYIRDYILFGEDDTEEIMYHPELAEACDLITTLLGKYNLDIKDNNIMQRGNTLVFIDPVWGKE